MRKTLIDKVLIKNINSFNLENKVLLIYDPVTGDTGFVKLEDGNFFILENGGKILTESYGRKKFKN